MEDLFVKDVTGDKKFWKTIKLLFSDKTKSSKTMILIEKNKVVTDNSDIAKTLNSYFTNVIKSLDIPHSEKNDQFYERIQTLILKSIVKSRSSPPEVFYIKRCS